MNNPQESHIFNKQVLNHEESNECFKQPESKFSI